MTMTRHTKIKNPRVKKRLLRKENKWITDVCKWSSKTSFFITSTPLKEFFVACWRALMRRCGLCSVWNVTSHTTLSIVDWSYKPTQAFSACFVLTRTFTENLSNRFCQARLTVEFLWSGYQKEDASYWYR